MLSLAAPGLEISAGMSPRQIAPGALHPHGGRTPIPCSCQGGARSERNLPCPREGELGPRAAPHNPQLLMARNGFPPRPCLLLEAGYSPGTAEQVKPRAWNQFGNISRHAPPPPSFHFQDTSMTNTKGHWSSLIQSITPSGRIGSTG